MDLLIKNARIISNGALLKESCVYVSDGKIVSLAQECDSLSAEVTIDAEGDYLTAGFIDLHTHGAGGCDFMDGTADAFRIAAQTHMQHGTCTLYPTTLSGSIEELKRSVSAFREAKDDCAVRMPGMHLEGPYFNIEMSGAQDPKYIRSAVGEEWKTIVEAADGSIARWSIAPEIEGSIALGKALRSVGIIPSIGHTNAFYEDVVKATENGYSLVTHLYSCTSTIRREQGYRRLGVTEAGLMLETLDVEVIADGCHLPPELLNFIYRVKGREHVIPVTDSMRAAGTDCTESILGSLEKGQRVLVEDGVAKLLDRTAFAGSVATTDRLLRVLVKEAGVPIEDAVYSMTHNPAKVMGLEKLGDVEPGYFADLIIFDEDINVNTVIINGEVCKQRGT